MEALWIVLIPLVVGALVFVSVLAAGTYGKRRAQKQGAAFQEYVALQYPDLPAPVELLCASAQLSMGRPDTALVLAEPRQEVLVLLDRGKAGLTHIAYPYAMVAGTTSANRIISRGPPTGKTYLYEQTMTVGFTDGSTHPFTLAAVTNKHGTDGAPAQVAALFAPWEARLAQVAAEAGGAAAPAATAGASWYADPTRRHELRYWDGQAWTDQVTDQGRQGLDPIETS